MDTLRLLRRLRPPIGAGRYGREELYASSSLLLLLLPPDEEEDPLPRQSELSPSELPLLDEESPLLPALRPLLLFFIFFLFSFLRMLCGSRNAASPPSPPLPSSPNKYVSNSGIRSASAAAFVSAHAPPADPIALSAAASQVYKWWTAACWKGAAGLFR